jgi:hypothetical protein
MLRVIVVDVEKFEVREEHWTEGIFLERAKAIIGDGPLDVVRYRPDMDIWIDDEGLLKNPRRFTAWEGRAPHARRPARRQPRHHGRG